jgi:hypothetical protein
MNCQVELLSPTALDTRRPEMRDWESVADYYEGPIDDIGATAMSITLEDERVENLVAENYDEPEALMGSLQGDLRKGDRRLAAHLLTVIRDESLESNVRALALETLAGARVRSLDLQVRDVIREALEGQDPELQFTAVAAASDLSRQSQVLLAGIIRDFANSNRADYWARRAAAAFLSRL